MVFTINEFAYTIPTEQACALFHSLIESEIIF